MPIGLLSIAMPAWLARHGYTVSDIAYFVSVVSLPWGLKLAIGPFMDRFSFPPMGRRRPWVMAAQAGLTLSLAALALVPTPVHHLTANLTVNLTANLTSNLALLMAIGFLVNTFSAMQDVAVDGMAIDVLPFAERGRANAMMGFGQAAGFSAFGALSGWLLAEFSLGVASAASAATVGAIFVFVTLTRERPGERLLPWSEGTAAPRTHSTPPSFKVIVTDLLRVLFLPMSIVLTVSEFFFRVRDAIVTAIQPVIAVQELGFAEDQYSRVLGIVGFITALLGVFFGPLIDRRGGKILLVGAALTSAAVTIVLASTTNWWQHTGYVVTMLFLGNLAGQVWFVALIAVYMGICWERIAATQFAIYMSLANLSRSVGGVLFALVAHHLDFTDDLLIAGACVLLAAAVVSRFDHAAHRRRLDDLNASAQTRGFGGETL